MGRSASRKKAKSTTSRQALGLIPQVSQSTTLEDMLDIFSKELKTSSGESWKNWSGAAVRPDISPNPCLDWPVISLAPFQRKVLGVDPAASNSDRSVWTTWNSSQTAVIEPLPLDTFDLSKFQQIENQIVEMMKLKDLTSVMSYDSGRPQHHHHELIRTMAACKGPYGYKLDPSSNPQFNHGYLWGPVGEWTALPAPPELVESAKKAREGDYVKYVGREHGFIHQARALMEYTESGHIAVQMTGGGFRFAGYENWAKYVNDTENKFGRPSDVNTIGRLLKLGSIWRDLACGREYVERWLGTMTHDRRYKLGCGVLHADDDTFDPFGLLAQINGATWTWNEDEEAYAYDFAPASKTRNCFIIPLGDLCDFLGVPQTRANSIVMEKFRDELTAISDGCKRFEQIANELGKAEEVYAEIDRVTKEALKHINSDYNPYPGTVTGRMAHVTANHTLTGRSPNRYAIDDLWTQSLPMIQPDNWTKKGWGP